MTLYVKYELHCDFCKVRIGKIGEWEFSPPMLNQDSYLPKPDLGWYVLGNNFACPRCIEVGRAAVFESSPVQRRLKSES